MIITDKFVMLAFPKTGSSFVRRNLKKIHGYNSPANRILRKLGFHPVNELEELILPVIDQEMPPVPFSRHVTYIQIPDEHRDKPVAAVVRNPFTRYLSAYRFGQWRETYQAYLANKKVHYPNFPEISFQEYYEFIHIYARENRLRGLKPKVDLGVYSIQFIQFFFRDPDQILRNIDEGYLEEGLFKKDLAPIIFLRQENLNQELYNFLSHCGYKEEQIAYLLKAPRVNVSPRSLNNGEEASKYTTELIEAILKRDRLIFDLFPEYRIPSNYN